MRNPPPPLRPGAGSMSIPITADLGRPGFSVQLSLAYDPAGMGPFGEGGETAEALEIGA